MSVGVDRDDLDHLDTVSESRGLGADDQHVTTVQQIGPAEVDWRTAARFAVILDLVWRLYPIGPRLRRLPQAPHPPHELERQQENLQAAEELHGDADY